MHIFIIILQLHGILFTIGKNMEGFLENFALETKIIDDVFEDKKPEKSFMETQKFNLLNILQITTNNAKTTAPLLLTL